MEHATICHAVEALHGKLGVWLAAAGSAAAGISWPAVPGLALPQSPAASTTTAKPHLYTANTHCMYLGLLAGKAVILDVCHAACLTRIVLLSAPVTHVKEEAGVY